MDTFTAEKTIRQSAPQGYRWDVAKRTASGRAESFGLVRLNDPNAEFVAGVNPTGAGRWEPWFLHNDGERRTAALYESAVGAAQWCNAIAASWRQQFTAAELKAASS